MRCERAKWTRNLKSVWVLAGAFLLGSVGFSAPQKDFMQESQAEKDARMSWWRDARFGLFIHWGLYAIPGGVWNGEKVDGIGEWIMNRAKIPLEEYKALLDRFNPVKYDPEQWAKMAKDAGMKYIVITSKHHDGFCLWDSEYTDYSVMSSPYGKDLLRPLVDACKEQGIVLCFYHSIMDWRHPNYAPLPAWDKARKGHEPDMDKYRTYLKNQVRELVDKYGPLGVLWFDGEWESTWTHENGVDLYNYVRGLQPSILVNNRVDKGRQGMRGLTKEGEFAGDFGTPEQEIPPEGLPGVDWESCMTMNDTWGFKKHDHNWKSKETLIRNLVDIASKGGNFLLNVGPTAEGEIPQDSVERLAAMGRWMDVNGEAIYGTTASPLGKVSFGRVTAKPGKLYLHIFDWPQDGKLVLQGATCDVKRAALLAEPDKDLSVKTSKKDKGVKISLPQSPPDPIVSVVVLEYEGELRVE